MAKGQQSKEIIYKKLLECFPDAFMADAKTMRIPFKEGGEVVEIKVALTAAKDVIGGDNQTETVSEDAAVAPIESVMSQPTEQEIANVNALLSKLGMKKG